MDEGHVFPDKPITKCFFLIQPEGKTTIEQRKALRRRSAVQTPSEIVFGLDPKLLCWFVDADSRQ